MTEELNLEETIGELVSDWCAGMITSPKPIEQNQLVNELSSLCRNYANEEVLKVHQHYTNRRQLDYAHAVHSGDSIPLVLGDVHEI